MAIDQIQKAPGITREEIIDFIDSYFEGKTQMRRTYDVLNILKQAKVLKVTNDKQYYYDPYTLDGSQAADAQNIESRISSDERQVSE